MSMNCLIVSATTTEIGPFLKSLGSGENYPVEIDVLISGVGMMASAFALSRQIHLKRPDLIIQAGIAGSFDQSIQLGTVFAVKKDTIADLGVTEKSKLLSIFDLGLARPGQFPFTNGWLLNKSPLLKKVKLRKIDAISCNEISTSKTKINFYKNKFDPAIESMEGAALHYVCLMERVPFIQIRSVSNYIGERNKKNWQLKASIANLNQELSRMLHTL